MILSSLFAVLLCSMSFASSNKNADKSSPDIVYVSNVERLLEEIGKNSNIGVTNDLDFSGYNSFVASENLSFSGTINGNFKKFKNLNVPLLSHNSGTVKNIILNSDSKTTANLDKNNYGNIARTNAGTISCIGVEKDYEFNCSFSDYEYSIGTICGINQGTIECSYFSGECAVFKNFTSNKMYCGGICGQSSGQLSYLYSTANFEFHNNYQLIFGKISGSSTSISCSFSQGDILVESSSDALSSAGYISGELQIIEDCFTYIGNNSLHSVSIKDLGNITSLSTESKISDFIDFASTSYSDYGVQEILNTKYVFKSEFYNAFGVENGGVYDDLVNVQLNNNPAILNGNSFTGGYIYKSGFYNLVITLENGLYQKNINFTINATISGIQNNGVYYYNDKPSAGFTSCEAELDGEPYSSNEIISEVGNHTLVFTGDNGYSFSYFFVVKPNVDGVEDGGVYDSFASYSVNGTYHFLDGKMMSSSDTTISVLEPGTHTLLIYGANGYSESRTFTVNLKVSSNNVLISDHSEYTGSVTFVISGGDAVIDGYYQYKSGDSYNRVGNHILTISGSTGFSKSFDFVVHPKIEGIESESFIASYVCSGGQSYLDGELIPNVYTIKVPGNHVLEVTGDNGYKTEKIYFSIKLSEALAPLDDGSFNFYFSGGTCYLDGKEFLGGLITEIGVHEIKVVGLNNTVFYYNNSLFVHKNLDFIPQNGITYSAPPVIPSLEAKVYLDGKLIPYNKEKRVEDHGKHVLHIVGVNYEKTVAFKYENPSYTNVFIYSGIAVISVALIVTIVVIRKKKGA